MSDARRRAFRRGFRDCSPFVLVVIPYSMLFGVVARDAGLAVYEVMSMSVLVIAGASQFTALALMQEHAPVVVVLLGALAVNLRMAMYSAALVPHVGGASLRQRLLMAYLMVDQTFAVSVKTFEEEPKMPLDQKVAYYFGCVMAVCPLWYVCTFAGAVLGQAIPPEFALDFAIPVCFIALVAPMMRSLPHVVAAGVSVLAAVLFGWMPYNLALVVAAALAMVAGAQTEYYLQRRAVRA
ncbi:AzlC family ABC transporter permease [Actibacterium sp. MT2.3-13A]|uniref:AzlC family ABC transporter permease n=1 Tax=Actibacterium sp. MT2.3-13A TaxID=2828332 RepID=UPI001BA47E0D|nr:AzlC family ABC transporter permease [Actibacterium sp. MT2.3-13A]